MWNISFITIGPDMTQNLTNAANNFFASYRKFAALQPVSIPSSYFTKGCVFNVTLIAKYQSYVSAPASITILAKIVGDIPKIKFASKSQYIQQYPGNVKTTLTMQIANTVCKKNAAASSSATLMPIKIAFQLFNGQDTIAMQKGGVEKMLEKSLTDEYNQNHILSIDRSSGLKYGLYYKLIASITNTNTGATNSDTIYFTFIKPAITSIINGVASVASISNDVTLNGANSSIPEAAGDFIEFRWSCISCSPLSASLSCGCPIIKRSNSFLPQLRISKTDLQALAYYTYALSITATNNGIKRTSSSQIQFVTYTGTARPMTGYSYAGNSLTVKDLYFSFIMQYNGSDSNLQYEWTLVEISSLSHKLNISYSEKNTYTTNFFKSLGIYIANPAISNDIAIPTNMTPTYITSNNQRVLGVDQNTLTPQLQYTFGIKVIYPDNPSFSFISFIAPKVPRTRLLSVTPSTGVGFSTVFSILFLLPAITDVDQATYQILRRDCPNQTITKSPLTEVLGQSNVYTTNLAPGSASCNYQVEITVRAFEYGSSIDQTCIVTVTAPPNPAAVIVANQLSAVVANQNSTTVDQKITSLCSLSSVNLTQPTASTKSSVQTMMDLISQLDSPTGIVMNLTDNTMKPQLLQNLAAVIGNIATNQAACVDLKTAGVMAAKINSYMNAVCNLTGGSSIIPTCLNTLNAIAQIGKNVGANSTFFTGPQQTLSNMSDIKVKEVQPGAPPFSLTSPTIELVAKKNYLSDFNGSQLTTTQAGNQLNLPGGLVGQLTTEIQKVAPLDGNALTLSTSLTTTNFNPFTNPKTNNNINVSSLSNYSSSIATPLQIGLIYKDLASGKLNDVVANSQQETSIIKVSMQPFKIQKTGEQDLIGKPIGISKFPDGNKGQFKFPTISNASNSANNSISVAFYYSVFTKKWTNDGCAIDNTNGSIGSVPASCDHIGNSSIKPSSLIKNEMFIIVDIIKDVLNVLESGNYGLLTNFGAFTNAAVENYVVFACVVVFFGLIAYLIHNAHKKDVRDVYDEKIKALYDKYGEKPEMDQGLLSRIFNLFSQMKSKGTNEAFKNMNSQEPISKSPSEKKVKKANPNNKRIPPNGFTTLEPHAAKEVKDLFHLYDEHKGLFSEDELYDILFVHINENVVLNRITQLNIEDAVIKTPPSFWTILKVKILPTLILYRLNIH